MRKITGVTAIVFALILTLPSTAALSFDAQQPQQLVDNGSLVLSPGETVRVEYQLGFEGDEVEVSKGIADSGDFTLNTPYGAENVDPEQNDPFLVDITAPDQSNYTKEIEFNFDVVTDQDPDDNDTSTETVTQSINATTKIPYEVLDGGDEVWYNSSYEFNLNGDDYNVSEIGNNIAVFTSQDNNSFQLGGSNDNQETVNNVRATLTDVVPNEYAKLRFESKESNSPSFSSNIVATTQNDEQECQLGISTQSGTTIQRGRLFSFDTINTVNGEKKESVSYQLKKTAGDNGIIAEGTTSATFATGEIDIPETLYQDNPSVKTLLLKLVKEGSGCEPVSKTVRLNTPYGTYIQNTDKFQLEISVDNTTTYGNITGTVTNGNGDTISSGILEAEGPDGEVVESKITQSSFSFDPEAGGQYTVKGTKSGYVDTEEVDVNYIADRDEDGVANSQDECPDTVGVEANNGCPLKESDIVLTGTVRESSSELYKGSVYGIRVLSDGDVISSYNGTIEVKGTDSSFSVDEGTLSGTESEGVRFDEEGRYTLVFNESGFEATEETYTVTSKPVVPQEMAVPLGGGAVIVILVLVLLRTDILQKSLGGSSSSAGDPGANVSTSLEPSGGDS
jgi:hypothetical protein